MTTAKKLLFEILSEEIPAGYIQPAADALAEFVQKKFEAVGLKPTATASFATPRRIAVVVSGLPDKQEARTKKVSGPPKKSAVAPDGSFTPVAVGFAAKHGKKAEDLQSETTPKGEYLFLNIEEPGRETARVAEEILKEAITSLPFKKTMRWGNGDLRYARPLRSILALFGTETLNVTAGGLKSGNTTAGHRFMSEGVITVVSPDDYESSLEKAHVTADPKKRKALVEKQFDDMGRDGIAPVRDDGLIDEVCNLTESPVAVVGSFKESYLDLPRELLVTVMKHHQRYFPAESPDGRITNKFVAFSNTACPDMTNVRKGYERVLTARLSDARFFFDEDRKHPLEHFQQKLAGVTYMKGLGSLADKVSRIRKISEGLARLLKKENTIDAQTVLDVETSADLCKFDLATQMVFEFPELQGIMGREYAKAKGVDGRLAEAIDQHYRPRFAGDALPGSAVASIVALADKIDAICACWAIDLIPTGSEDPYSLRRHALGIIRILLENGMPITIAELADTGNINLPDDLRPEGRYKTWSKEAIKGNFKAIKGKGMPNFFIERIKYEFKTRRNLDYDVIDAVLFADTDHYYLTDLLNICEALTEVKKLPYAQDLAITFRRAANITKGKEKLADVNAVLNEKFFQENAEKDLYNAYLEKERVATPLKRKADYRGALKEIAEMRTYIDKFFDSVMVMDAGKPELMNNRIALLRTVTGLFGDMADFSKLVF
ncbi:MAG: glycine--tRNA ligase subunit beta [Nitrospinae bacterium]|nr:glycine--tRNA ligase subunit beta [Nitrospinota bacterium]